MHGFARISNNDVRAGDSVLIGTSSRQSPWSRLNSPYCWTACCHEENVPVRSIRQRIPAGAERLNVEGT